MSIKKILLLLLTIGIFYFAIVFRISLFEQQSDDYGAYREAMDSLVAGRNLYLATIESFDTSDDPQNTGDHGFSYFPGLLYSNLLFENIGKFFEMPDYVSWKIPVLLADIGIGALLILILKSAGALYFIPAILFWYFNPYMVSSENYVNFDNLPIFFMLLALYYCQKSDIKSGVSFSLAFLLKTFPFILLPILFIRATKKQTFVLAAAIPFIVASIPFMKSLQDIVTYIRGTLLVHGNRVIQGRPFLFFISYFGKIEFFRLIPINVYAQTAFIGSTLLSGVTSFFTKVNVYVLSTFSFIFFYIFTPVLNRTYLLWFMPLYAISSYYWAKDKRYSFVIFLLFLGSFWGFYHWYLELWHDGFDIWRPPGVYFDH